MQTTVWQTIKGYLPHSAQNQRPTGLVSSCRPGWDLIAMTIGVAAWWWKLNPIETHIQDVAKTSMRPVMSRVPLSTKCHCHCHTVANDPRNNESRKVNVRLARMNAYLYSDSRVRSLMTFFFKKRYDVWQVKGYIKGVLNFQAVLLLDSIASEQTLIWKRLSPAKLTTETWL